MSNHNKPPFKYRKVARPLAALALALCALGAAALPEDQQQPVHITADSAVQENNSATYKGKVVIIQGTIRIEADQVVIYHEKGKLQRAVATGKPVRFQEQPEAGGGLITGYASTLIYYSAEQRVELLQNALVDRDKSTVKGSKIEYLLANKTVRAEGGTSNQPGQVEMVLQPNQPKPAESAPAPAPAPTNTGTTTPPATPGSTPATGTP